MRFQDFVLQIEASSRGGLRARVLASPFGEGTVPFPLPSSAASRPEPQDGRDIGKPDTPPLLITRSSLEIGTELFRAAFHGQVRMLFDKSRGQLHDSPDRGLRLKIKLNLSDEETGMLANLPWELLCDDETDDFFALSRQTSLVRYLDVPRPSQPIPFEPPLRILAISAAPRNLPALDFAAETRGLDSLNGSSSGIEARFLTRASSAAVRAALAEDNYNIVHFMGHGTFDRASGEGMLVFEREDGTPDLVSGRVFATKLKDLRRLGIVLLNACDTAQTGEGGVSPFRGVAAALVHGGVPAVVAMQRKISDAAAIGFSAALYRHLASGHSIDEALTEGRQAIHSLRPETFEWATPALFLRIPDGNVFVAKPAGPPEEIPPKPSALNGLRGLFLLAASLGSLLPGFAFFLDFSPPFFSGTALITALAAAVVAIAYAWPRKRRLSDEKYKKELLRAAVVTLVSFLLTISYIPLYRLTTVAPPVPPPTVTCQTGFGLTHLTPGARQFVQNHPALANPQDLMLAYAAFAGCRSDLIWEPWSISLMGVALIAHFSMASLLWALGFAWLARLLSGSSRRKVLALLLAAWLCACMSERLPSAHPDPAKRLKKLEGKVKELDGRASTGEAPAHH